MYCESVVQAGTLGQVELAVVCARLDRSLLPPNSCGASSISSATKVREVESLELLSAGDASWSMPFKKDGHVRHLLQHPNLFPIYGRYYMLLSGFHEESPCVGYLWADSLEGPYHDGGMLFYHDGGPVSWVPGPDGKSYYVGYRNSDPVAGSNKLHIDQLVVRRDQSLEVDQSWGDDRIMMI